MNSAQNQELANRYKRWLTAQRYSWVTGDTYTRAVRRFVAFLKKKSVLKTTHFDVQEHLCTDSHTSSRPQLLLRYWLASGLPRHQRSQKAVLSSCQQFREEFLCRLLGATRCTLYRKRNESLQEVLCRVLPVNRDAIGTGGEVGRFDPITK